MDFLFLIVFPIIFSINTKAQQFNLPNQQALAWQQFEWHKQERDNGNPGDSTTFRLIDELLGIFVPPHSFGNVERNDDLINNENSNNYLMPRMARSEDNRAERIELDSPSNNNNDKDNNQPWAHLARGVIDLFKSIETTTPTTTTTTTTQMSLLERVKNKKNSKIFNPFGGTTTMTTTPSSTLPPLFPFFARTTTTAQPSFFSFLRKEQPRRETENELLMRPNQLLVEPVARLFGVERKAVEEGRAQIDTGGPNFDRFVVRQKSASDNPFASIVGGSKWNERGIKWEDGNIRLVDKNGPPLFPFFARTTTTAQPSFFSFLRKEQPRRETENELLMRPNQLLVEPVARLFGVERKAVEEGRAQIDTGGPNFDRFVVRQKSASDNPFASIVGGSKWNERGIKWEDGNIRLVDKNGNSLLGTEVGVNDRSVDIPLKRWLEIANGIVNFQQTQRDYVTRK